MYWFWGFGFDWIVLFNLGFILLALFFYWRYIKILVSPQNKWKREINTQLLHVKTVVY